VGDYPALPLFSLVGSGSFSNDFEFNSVLNTFTVPNLESCARLAFVPGGGYTVRGLTFLYVVSLCLPCVNSFVVVNSLCHVVHPTVFPTMHTLHP
jgi:hypothetical protein